MLLKMQKRRERIRIKVDKEMIKKINSRGKEKEESIWIQSEPNEEEMRGERRGGGKGGGRRRRIEQVPRGYIRCDLFVGTLLSLLSSLLLLLSLLVF